MKIFSSRINKSIIFTLILFFSLYIISLTGCADSEPKVVATSSYVIFDYPDEKSNPSVRLAIFIETSSDVHRASKFTVTSRDSSYMWYCHDPVIFSNDKRKWAGYTDFVIPSDESFPSGFYDVEYFDAQERSFSSVVSVNFQSKFEEATVENLDSILDGKYRENVALYNKENTVLYYGEMKDSWKTDKRIFSAFPSSSFFRKCIILSSSNTILLLPPVYKDKVAENSDSAESLNSSEKNLQ